MSTHLLNCRSAFSLVEMLMALLAGSVLAVTMGGMMWSATLTWKRTGRALELQRDMQTSMDTLARVTRSATSTTFSGGSVYTARYSAQPPASVYTSTNSLYFDPNTSVTGDVVRLANNDVRQFAITIATNSITIVLCLQNTSDAISNRVVLARRN